MLDLIKEQVYQANLMLPEHGLVTFTGAMFRGSTGRVG
jgi:hypothetical protein